MLFSPSQTIPARRAGFLALAVCLAACSGTKNSDSNGKVTFSRDVAPILYESCSSCHRKGGSSPFSLVTYSEVERRAVQVSRVTRDRFMPPWLPVAGDLAFVGDRALTEEQIDVFRLWVKQGAIEGDASELPPLPEWTEGWELGEPDLVVELPESYTLPAEGFDVFRNFVIPLEVERPRWVSAVEVHPGNKRVVHHAVMHIDRTPSSRVLDEQDADPGFGGMELGYSVPPDGYFVGWTPGKSPHPPTEGMAWRLDRGTDLVLQLHMLPTGKPESIRPKIGLYLADRAPTLRPFVIVLRDDAIDIPPGEKAYVVRDEFLLPVPVEVLGVYPHAHYLAKTIRVTATLPDETERELLRIDDWDFNWQDDYRYVESLPLPAGSRLLMEYVYDNSASNERNPTLPPRRVTSGNRSIDEMATLSLQVLARSDGDLLTLEEAQSRHTLEKDPGSFAGNNNLGNALLRQGRLEEAVERLQRATEIRPDLADAFYNLGVALAASGRYEVAVARYREALRLNPSFAAAENNLGNALLALDLPGEAGDHYRAAVRLRPEFEEAHYNLGNLSLTSGRFEEAIASYRLALRADPNVAMTYNNLAVALQADGRPEQALIHFRKALEIDGELAEAHRNLGMALLEQRLFDEAIVHLREGIRLHPEDGESRRALERALASR